eukprot:scaffold9.g3096.t1
MSSRREAETRAQKQSALALLAARRRGDLPRGGGILGLESSSEDDDEGSSAYSEEGSDREGRWENSGHASNSGGSGAAGDSSRQPAKPLSRLRKAGAPLRPPPQAGSTGAGGVTASRSSSLGSGGDDLATQLGGLSIAPAHADSSNSSRSGGSLAPGGARPVQLGQSGSWPAARAPPAGARSGHAAGGEPAPRAGEGRPSARDAGPRAGAATGEARVREAAEEGCLVLGERGEFRLTANLSRKLYPHQVEGVRWLWGLHKMGRGGLLGDDMGLGTPTHPPPPPSPSLQGLGKTMQCCAFLAGMLQSWLIRRAIVVAPKTLLAHWKKELEVCGVGPQAQEFFGSAGERAWALGRVLARRGVLLTTYGMVQHNSEQLAAHEEHDPDEGPLWDVMILDEGHKIKNPKMQLRAHLDAIPAGMRLIISGTPIQNNLMEMHTLFDFCVPGLLGDAHTFKVQYERRITVGADKHATQGERERGAAAAEQLRRAVAPYLLRREKKQVFKSSAEDGAPGAGSGGGAGAAGDSAGTAGGAAGAAAPKPPSMGHKNDLIVWLTLQPMQRRVYEAFLNSDSVKAVFNQTSSALAALSVLKKICDHPALLSENAQRGIISGAERAARRARGGGGASGGEEESEGDSIDSSSGDESDDAGGRTHPRAPGRAARAAAAAEAAACAEAAAGLFDWAGDGTAQSLLDQAGGSTPSFCPRARRGASPPPLACSSESASPPPSPTHPLAARPPPQVHRTGFEASCKTAFIMGLLPRLVADGHRTLIFSQSRVMLNILEAAVKARGWRYCRRASSGARRAGMGGAVRAGRARRIDGSVAAAGEREARVRAFQTDLSIPLFLLTSQVGGLGLTLTAADRVVICDPAWNPSVDDQSVDRAYRIGQARDVVVYRLISCGTVEEKIYRRQVFKGGLSRTGTEAGEQFRYFSQEELLDLFRFDPAEAARGSETQRELERMHARQRRATPGLAEHLRFLQASVVWSLEGFAGVSDHDLLFSKKDREAPAGEPRFGSAPPEAPPAAGGGAGGGAPRVRVGRPGSGASRAATQGWAGASDLSDVFSRALQVGGSGGAGGRAGAGAFGLSAAAFQLPGGVADLAQLEREARAAELQEALRKQRWIMSNPVLVAGLKDNGAKIRAKVAELERELAEARRGQQERGGGAGGGGAVGVAAGAGAAAPAAAEAGGSGGSDGRDRARVPSDGGSSGYGSGGAGAGAGAATSKPQGEAAPAEASIWPGGVRGGASHPGAAAAASGSVPLPRTHAPRSAASTGAPGMPGSITGASRGDAVAPGAAGSSAASAPGRSGSAAGAAEIEEVIDLVGEDDAAAAGVQQKNTVQAAAAPSSSSRSDAAAGRGQRQLPAPPHGGGSGGGAGAADAGGAGGPPQQPAREELPPGAAELREAAKMAKKKAYWYAEQLKVLAAEGGGGGTWEAKLRTKLDGHYARYKAAKKQLSLVAAAETGIPETQVVLENARITARGRTAYCPHLAVGEIMGQRVLIGTTGINAVAAALCTSQLLSCGPLVNEILWIGTSGWSPQVGGVLDSGDCSRANQSPEVTRIGDVCVSPMGLSWCFRSDWEGEAAEPAVFAGPADAELFGRCLFGMSAASRALADELAAAARAAAVYPTRSWAVQAFEERYWEVMRAGTGVRYALDPAAPPAVYDYRRCAEVASPNIWSGHPWDAQARGFVAQLISASGAANVSKSDVIAVAGMEASGLLDALAQAAVGGRRSIPVAIVRGNSNYVSSAAGPGVWVAGPQVQLDPAAGYSLAIQSSSAAVLSLLQARCLRGPASARSSSGGGGGTCAYSVGSGTAALGQQAAGARQVGPAEVRW